MLIPLEKLFQDYSLKVSGVIHVGAHIGEEADAYRRCGITQVAWIEANPELIAQLEAHLVGYGHRVIQALVSDCDAQYRHFYVTNNKQSSSLLELEKHQEHYPQITVEHTVPLFTRSLDSLAKEFALHGYNFLNLDIQGAELLALRGARTLLSGVEYIYTEVNTAELYRNCADLSALDEFLKDFTRVELTMTGAEWGDAFYIRHTSTSKPRSSL